MWKKQTEVYEIISATGTTDVYYIFMMPPTREVRGHQMTLVKASICKKRWHLSEWGEDCLKSCQRTLWKEQVSFTVRVTEH